MSFDSNKRYITRVRTGEIAVRVIVSTSSSSSEELAGYAEDISPMGLCIRLKQTLPIEKSLIVSIRIPGEERDSRLQGIIAWRKDSEKLYGIQFVDLSDDQLAPIHAYAESKGELLLDRRSNARRGLDQLSQTKLSRIDFVINRIRRELDSRVVVTGIGIVSPIGIGLEKFTQSLKDGKSGVDRISFFDTSKYTCHLAAEVKDFSPTGILSHKKRKLLERSTQFAIVAASQAFEDSSLRIGTDILSTDVGVYIGTTTSGHYDYYKQLMLFLNKGPDSISPFAVISCFPDACSGQVSIHFKLRGPSTTINTGCASGASAITRAYMDIKNGHVKAALAGGTDCPIFEPLFAGFHKGKILSRDSTLPAKTPKPFEKNRDGTILGEGASMLILESLDAALARNANIYGEIIGFGSTCDAYRMVGPDLSGRERERALRLAMSNSLVRPEQVQYINAHGTGTKSNDKLETKIIKKVFGSLAKKIPISSLKSMIGHTQGACGALELAACLLAMRDNFLPPTINLDQSDPDCDLDYVPNKSRPAKIDLCLSNSFAFGGKNEVIALRKLK